MAKFDISLRQMRYFVYTAEMGQISLAAQELNITQSAVTIAIKELESKLNIELFIRTSKRMVLTEYGKQLFDYCNKILNILESIQHIQDSNSEITGELRIGASFTVLGYYLPNRIKRLQNMYPNVQFKIFEMSRLEIEESLLNNKLDIAVLVSSNVNNTELMVKTFLESQRMLWVGSDHPLLQKENVDYIDIANEPYIMLNVDEAHMTAKKYLEDNNVKPNIYLQTSSVEAVRSMVANGIGICILSNAVYRPWSLEGKRVHRIKLVSKIPPMNLGIAWKASNEQNELKKIFIDYFLENNN